MGQQKNRQPENVLDWLHLRRPPDWAKARWLGGLVGFVLMLVLVLVLALAFAAMVLVLRQTFLQALPEACNGPISRTTDGPNLGAGALIAAVLGAPFVIWATWLRHQTLRYQKEGHITDRINTAVEMLGAEKTVKVRSRNAEGTEVTVEETKSNIEVRIGAILSLERIAQDSTTHDRGRDHVRVMEILCAYVRENAPASNAKNSLRQDWERESAKWDGNPAQFEEWFCREYKVSQAHLVDLTDLDTIDYWAKNLPKPRIDIALALQVIGRRTPAQRLVEAAWPDPPDETTVWPFDIHCPTLPNLDEVEHPERVLSEFEDSLGTWKRQIQSYTGYQLDLRGTNLQGASLSAARADRSDAVFCGALLHDVRLEGAKLLDARFEGATIWGASMDGADAFRAHFSGADLRDSRMEKAEFGKAWLQGADFNKIRMAGVELYQAYLQGAYLGSVVLDDSQLGATRMEGVTMLHVSLARANLSETRIDDATLFGVSMDSTVFLKTRLNRASVMDLEVNGGADLEDLILDDAILKSTDLSKAFLSQEQVNAFRADASVILPEGLTRPAHWTDEELE